MVFLALSGLLAGSAAFAQDAGLRSLAAKRGLLIGGALRLYPETMADPQYLPTFAREFNVVVPEHAMKFDATHPRRDAYDFRAGDFVVKFASEHGMLVRGHTLVWHEAIPAWVLAYKDSAPALRAILHDYIATVAAHFAGRLLSWDVVNEAVDEDGRLSPTAGPWPKIDEGRAPGAYIADAFRWAREADPKALLFYNDYGAETVNKKSDGIYALLKKLRDDGVPVQGIGFQTHVAYDDAISEESLRANFKRFSDLGLVIHITEMDVGVTESGKNDPKVLALQAEKYRLFLAVCLETPRCQAFLTWGLTDKYSWLDGGAPARLDDRDLTAPLLLDRNYRPKPAYDAVAELLKGPRLVDFGNADSRRLAVSRLLPVDGSEVPWR